MPKKVLGKGLGALLSEQSVFGIAEVIEITLSDIVPNSFQPRKFFDEEKLSELAQSIQEKGLIQPIIVRKKLQETHEEKNLPKNQDNSQTKFEIIVGERRYRACKQLGFSKIPAIVKESSNYETLELALIENIQRQDLNPIEEAESYKELLEHLKLTHQELSAKIGKSRTVITNTLRLLKLPISIQRDLTSQKLSSGHARALLGLREEKEILLLRDLIIEEELSVRQTEKQVQDLTKYHKNDSDESPSSTEASQNHIEPKQNYPSDSYDLKTKENKLPLQNLNQKLESEKLSELKELAELEEQLQKYLKTKVHIQKLNQVTHSAKIEIHYESSTQLRSILNRIGISL